MQQASSRDPEDQLREIYTCFGISAQYAQNLETWVIAVLKLAARARNFDIANEELAELDEQLSTRTLGRLLRELRSQVTVDGPMEADLAKALAIRNLLIHRWFHLNASNLMSERGRLVCLTELRAMADHLSDAVGALRLLVEEYFRRIGWSAEDVDRGLAFVLRSELPEGPDFDASGRHSGS